MDIDHVFIFTNDHRKAIDELISFGLTAGASRVHEGQGTTNQVFSFENFYFEILWVHNEAEIKSDLIKPIGLWQRANYKTSNFSPFGVCIANTDETDKLFEQAFKYQPDYFPAGMTIDILNNDKYPDMPWTFRLPFKGERRRESKPPVHKNGIKKLTKAQFTYISEQAKGFADKFSNEPTITFKKDSELKLTLTFDNHNKGLKKEFMEINLTIEY